MGGRRDAPVSKGSNISAIHKSTLASRVYLSQFTNFEDEAHAFRRLPHRIVHLALMP
jgi:hypothetical protein